MAVASPRLFLALRLFLPPSVSLCLSLPFFLPPPPVLALIVLIVLFVLPLALNPFHTQLLPTYMPTHVYTPIHIRVHAYAHIHTCAKCIPRCFRSLCVPSFDPSSSSSTSFSSFRSFFPPVRSTHGLPTYVCPDLKIVRLVPSRSP